MVHVVIAGAGIVGVSSAIWLQRAGHEVTLVDRMDGALRTSYGNAGVLAAGAILPVPVPGLAQKLPKMVFSRDEPLFLRMALSAAPVALFGEISQLCARRSCGTLRPFPVLSLVR